MLFNSQIILTVCFSNCWQRTTLIVHPAWTGYPSSPSRAGYAAYAAASTVSHCPAASATRTQLASVLTAALNCPAPFLRLYRERCPHRSVRSRLVWTVLWYISTVIPQNPETFKGVKISNDEQGLLLSVPNVFGWTILD